MIRSTNLRSVKRSETDTPHTPAMGEWPLQCPVPHRAWRVLVPSASASDECSDDLKADFGGMGARGGRWLRGGGGVRVQRL